MKKIFNIQNRIVARAEKTIDEATVMIELSDHMWIVAFYTEGYTSSAPCAKPLATVPNEDYRVCAPGYS